jgi:hypothetical protein
MSTWRKQAALGAALLSILAATLSAQETPGFGTRYENARRFFGEQKYAEAHESLGPKDRDEERGVLSSE